MLAALIRHFKVVAVVRECYRKQGIDWDYMYKLKLRYKLAFDSDFDFFEETDSCELRQAKQNFLKSRAKYRRAFGVTVLLFALGFLGSIVCSMMQVMHEPPH